MLPRRSLLQGSSRAVGEGQCGALCLGIPCRGACPRACLRPSGPCRGAVQRIHERTALTGQRDIGVMPAHGHCIRGVCGVGHRFVHACACVCRERAFCTVSPRSARTLFGAGIARLAPGFVAQAGRLRSASPTSPPPGRRFSHVEPWSAQAHRSGPVEPAALPGSTSAKSTWAAESPCGCGPQGPAASRSMRAAHASSRLLTQSGGQAGRHPAWGIGRKRAELRLLAPVACESRTGWGVCLA